MVRYSELEDDVIRNNYGKEPVRIWINMLPGRTPDSIITRANRLGLSSGILNNQATAGNYARPRFSPRLPKANDKNWEGVWEAAYAFQKVSIQLSTRVDEQDIYLNVDHPIGLTILADGHIGAIDTPLDFIRCRVELIEQYRKWLYLIDAGDTIDNFKPTKHPEGVFGEIFPPAIQKEFAKNLYMKLKGNWLVKVQGCHEEWSHDTDDFDFTSWLCDELGCANLGHGGIVNLHVGKQIYKIALRHKYRYNSSYNPVHTCMQLVRFDYKDADIAIVAHNHITAVLQNQESDKDRIYVRPGSMKGPDRYARSMGYIDTGKQMPIIILWPDKRQMLAFMDLEQALEIFKNLTVL